jgi:hypothetical protein
MAFGTVPAALPAQTPAPAGGETATDAAQEFLALLASLSAPAAAPQAAPEAVDDAPPQTQGEDGQPSAADPAKQDAAPKAKSAPASITFTAPWTPVTAQPAIALQTAAQTDAPEPVVVEGEPVAIETPQMAAPEVAPAAAAAATPARPAPVFVNNQPRFETIVERAAAPGVEPASDAQPAPAAAKELPELASPHASEPAEDVEETKEGEFTIEGFEPVKAEPIAPPQAAPVASAAPAAAPVVKPAPEPATIAPAPTAQTPTAPVAAPAPKTQASDAAAPVAITRTSSAPATPVVRAARREGRAETRTVDASPAPAAAAPTPAPAVEAPVEDAPAAFDSPSIAEAPTQETPRRTASAAQQLAFAARITGRAAGETAQATPAAASAQTESGAPATRRSAWTAAEPLTFTPKHSTPEERTSERQAISAYQRANASLEPVAAETMAPSFNRAPLRAATTAASSVYESVAAAAPIETGSVRAEAAPAQPLREISLVVPQPKTGSGEASEPVEVKVLDRSGQLHVAVRSADPQLNASLRDHLGDLVTRLEDRGYRTETWRPSDAAAASNAVSSVSETTGRSFSGFERDGYSHAGRDGQSSGGDQSSEQQRRGRDETAPEWLEALEQQNSSNGRTNR